MPLLWPITNTQRKRLWKVSVSAVFCLDILQLYSVGLSFVWQIAPRGYQVAVFTFSTVADSYWRFPSLRFPPVHIRTYLLPLLRTCIFHPPVLSFSVLALSVASLTRPVLLLIRVTDRRYLRYRLIAKFHYTDPTGPARTQQSFAAKKSVRVRAGPVGSVSGPCSGI